MIGTVYARNRAAFLRAILSDKAWVAQHREWLERVGAIEKERSVLNDLLDSAALSSLPPLPVIKDYHVEPVVGRGQWKKP